MQTAFSPCRTNDFEFGPVLGTGRYAPRISHQILPHVLTALFRCTVTYMRAATTASSASTISPGCKISLRDGVTRGNVCSFGRVRLATHSTTGTVCAVKILSKAQILNQDQLTHMKQEKAILDEVAFPFMVNLFGATQVSVALPLHLSLRLALLANLHSLQRELRPRLPRKQPPETPQLLSRLSTARCSPTLAHPQSRHTGRGVPVHVHGVRGGRRALHTPARRRAVQRHGGALLRGRGAAGHRLPARAQRRLP